MCKKMSDELKMIFLAIYLQFKSNDKKYKLQKQVETYNNWVETAKNNDSCSLGT